MSGLLIPDASYTQLSPGPLCHVTLVVIGDVESLYRSRRQEAERLSGSVITDHQDLIHVRVKHVLTVSLPVILECQQVNPVNLLNKNKSQYVGQSNPQRVYDI